MRSLDWCFVLALSLVLAACGAPAQPARPAAVPAASAGATAADPAASRPGLTSAGAPAKIRIGYVTLAPNVLPAVWLPTDYGLFDKYGLDAELTYIAGSAKIAGALLAGEIDVAVGPGEVAMGPGLEGADTVMIASWAYKMGFSLMGQPYVQSPADVRGRRVGITRRGSNSELWVNAVLSPFGLQPETDYTPLAVGGLFEQIAALENRAIDVGVIGIPANLRGRELGYHDLLPPEQSVIDFADVGLVTTRRYLQAQPELVDRLLRVSAEGVAMIFDDAPRTLDSIRRYTEVEDQAQLDETLAFQRLRTTRDMMPTAAGLQKAMEELARGNPRAATANPEDYVDLTAVRRLNDSGFIQSLRR
jgi:ABC-type nitrate/sulfonate/bicarbonate transport system substrate-binding protein